MSLLNRYRRMVVILQQQCNFQRLSHNIKELGLTIDSLRRSTVVGAPVQFMKHEIQNVEE